MMSMDNLVKNTKQAYPFLTYPLTFSCSEGLKTEMLCHSVLLSSVSLKQKQKHFQ